MPETDNNPVVNKVRELQRQLWVCAKQSKTRRFHAWYDRISRSDVLALKQRRRVYLSSDKGSRDLRRWSEAGKRVRTNKGAAGVDEVTWRSIEEQGVTQFLEGIQADLQAGRYRPSAVRRQYIPKGDGKQR